MQAELLEIYTLLLDFFGPRNWWPGDSPLEVIIGAILTQNTSWKNVEKAINCIKRAEKLSPQEMFGIKEEEFAELIKSSGFYRLKAKRIKSFTDFLFSHYHGDLNKMGITDTSTLRTQLLGINGIGEETADSILLYALNRPVFVIDAYTKRIFSRLGHIGEKWNYAQVQEFFMKNLPWDSQLFNDYHAQIVKLGNTLCHRTNPHCEDCPLKGAGEQRCGGAGGQGRKGAGENLLILLSSAPLLPCLKQLLYHLYPFPNIFTIPA